jgi:hypothetical protein
VAGVPSIVRHHFLIRAVLVEAAFRAEARMVKLPEAFEPSRVDQETVGAEYAAYAASELGKIAKQPTSSKQDKRYPINTRFTSQTLAIYGQLCAAVRCAITLRFCSKMT